ncbi:MAG: ParA family protein [Pseudomonadota bacterium]
MRTVLVVNSKGGCGKTTLATTLASGFASAGARVALADGDRQKSATHWLKRRPKSAPRIEWLDWSKAKKLGDAPKGLDWLIVDAPGALRGGHAEELAAEADAVLVPVMASVFDTDATKRFLAGLDRIKRIRKGKTALGVVANRIRPRTRAASGLVETLEKAGTPPIAQINERAIYGELASQGLALYDRRGAALTPLFEQWQPLMEAIRRDELAIAA